MSDEEFPRLINVQIDGGVRLFDKGDHWIDAMAMLYNWRLVETPKNCPLLIDRWWCYQGRSRLALMALTLAAMEWIKDDAAEPQGWIKAWDGRRGEDLTGNDYE